MAKRIQIATFVPGGKPRAGNQNGRALESALESSEAIPEPDVLAEGSRALSLIEKAQQQGAPGVMSTVQDPMASLLQSYLAKYTPENQMEETASGALEAKFDERDALGWVSSVFTWWKKLRKFPWQDSGPVTALSNKARVAVFGDWATGLYGAPEVSKSIVKDSTGYQLVIHLGDTYYSGDDDEVTDRLMGFWPHAPNATYRALNGNHEMYTGGNAYMQAVKAFGQQTSYFAFQNDHWILACLDTSYADHDLHGNQAQWLESLSAGAGGRRLVLFSHHQPYSLLDSQGPRLVAKLSSLLNARKIFAWYWGHEHRCVLYEPHAAWGLLGRCIGHGGFPYFRDKLGQQHAAPDFVTVPSKNFVPGADILEGPNPFVTDHENRYGPHGYATLEFDGPRLNEVVMDAEGKILRSREIAKA